MHVKDIKREIIKILIINYPIKEFVSGYHKKDSFTLTLHILPT